jgi:hypothetical protein
MIRKIQLPIIFVSLLVWSMSLGSPVAAAESINVVESEAGFYYTIQKGDTLWDLSQHFNNSPWLWPELWEDNDQISNPHWIFPGERIRLYKKSGLQTMVSSQPDQPPKVIVPIAPQPEKASSGPFYMYSSIDRVGFIRTPPVPAAGTIFEVQGRKVLISEGDMIYIRPSQDPSAATLIPGGRQTVYRTMSPTKERNAIETIGTQHYILGIVEVTKKEPDMVIAKVLKSYRPIKVDDQVMPYGPRHEKIQLKPSTPGIDGRIIITEEHTDLAGEYVLAFIDKGRADNIQVGQQYSVYSKQKLVLENDKIGTKELPPVDFGTFLVLHTEQTTSTVIITDAAKSISPGERFRTPIN